MISVDLHKKLSAPAGNLHLDVSMTIGKGSLCAIYGDSGAGKTSTLRMIAGLMRPDHGRIAVNDRNWFDSQQSIDVPPQKRNTGFVFQDYALFPHLTVAENIGFACKDRRLIRELVELMGLGDLRHSKPDILSGGQQQRVALARAIAQKPDLLLLDEPMAALDGKTRFRLQEYLLKVKKEYELTIIMITHDIGEIHRLADMVYEMKNGKIARSGTPAEVFQTNRISGKFRFKGEVIRIDPSGVTSIITVLIGTELTRVITSRQDTADLKAGDHVMVATKAFDPIIYKIDE